MSRGDQEISPNTAHVTTSSGIPEQSQRLGVSE